MLLDPGTVTPEVEGSNPFLVAIHQAAIAA